MRGPYYSEEEAQVLRKALKLTKQIQTAQTVEDLEALNIGEVVCDISYRGGGLGFWGSDVAAWVGIEVFELPRKFGAGCNYLGGGLRGSIFPSSFSNRIAGKQRTILECLAAACVRVYKNIENESGLNDEEDENGETNWDAKGTRASRNAGIISAY